MKKFSLFFVIVMVSVLSTGCTAKTKSLYYDYPWSVDLVVLYEYENMHSDYLEKTGNVKTALVNQYPDADVYTLFQKDNNILQVEFIFENYTDYMNMFGLVEQKQVYVVEQKSLFYYEYERTFENPWKSVFLNSFATLSNINNAVTSVFGASHTTDYIYVFESEYRRSEVAGSYYTEQYGSYYYYHFDANIGEASNMPNIVIYDRFANTPIWYVLAVGATVVFMIIMYIIFAKTKKKGYNESWQSQSSPTSTET